MSADSSFLMLFFTSLRCVLKVDVREEKECSSELCGEMLPGGKGAGIGSVDLKMVKVFCF